MPYVSLAQARKFHADPKLKKFTAEYDAATNFHRLPERVSQAKRHRKPTRAERAARATALTRMLAAGGNHKPSSGGTNG